MTWGEYLLNATRSAPQILTQGAYQNAMSRAIGFEVR
jgi:hypothetical protein